MKKNVLQEADSERAHLAEVPAQVTLVGQLVSVRKKRDYACAYAAIGFRVFPVFGLDEYDRCECGKDCCSPGKHPRIAGWQTYATTDIAAIDRWWSESPNANIAILTGPDCAVADIDDPAALERIEETFGPLASFCVRTPSGLHVYFRGVAGLRSGTNVLKDVGIPGVDIRANDGYVLAEGSVAYSKRRNGVGTYVAQDHDVFVDGRPQLDPAPDWMAAKVIGAEGKGPDNEVPVATTFAVSDELLDEISSAMAVIDPESRDNWVLMGLMLKTLANNAGRRLWDEWSVSTESGRRKYDALDQERAWRSFLPRSITYRSIFYLAQKNGWPGLVANTVVPLPASEQPKPVQTAELISKCGKPLFSHFGRMQPAAAHWLIKGIIPDGELLLLFGEPGGGKSFFALDWAAHIATGKPWQGKKVRQGAVFYIAGEGHHGLVRRRMAWEKHHGQSLCDAPMFVSNRAVALLDDRTVKQVVAEVRALVEEHGIPALIVVDTLARSFAGGDENVAADMATFIAALDEMRAEFGCSVLIVHHTGHADKTRIRGSSALQGAIDTGYRLEKAGTLGLKLVCVKAKDFEPPEPLAFNLQTVELSGLFDEDGNVETSAVIANVTATSAAEGILESEPGKRGKGHRQQQALAILRDMEFATNEPIPIEAWKAQMRANGINRQRISDLVKSMAKECLIVINEETQTVKIFDLDDID